MSKFKKAVIFQNGGIGDFLMALFLAEELKNNGIADRTEIVLHRAAGFLRGFMADYDFVSLTEISKHRPKSIISILGLFRPNTLIILPPTIGCLALKVKFLAWFLSKMPHSFLVGFQDNGRFCQVLYSKVLPYKINQTFDKSMYDILHAISEGIEEKTPRLKITPSREIITRLGLSGKKYIFFHPRGSSERRRLSENDVKYIIESTLSNYKEIYILLSGAENEREAIEGMFKVSGSSDRVVPVIGVNPAELAALIEGAEIFMGMDTGITHMACLMEKKALVIAKNATANWLPYYNKNATVVFRFEEDEKSETSESYMWAHQNNRLRPFKDILASDVFSVLRGLIEHP